MAYNTTSDLRHHLRIESGNDKFTDAELTSYLNRANSLLFDKIKRKVETYRGRVGYNDYDGAVCRKFDLTLPFDDDADIHSVYINGELQTVTTHYTIDSTLGRITVVTSVSLSASDQIEINYVPEIYKQTELYIALHIIGLDSNLVSADGTAVLSEKYKHKYNELIKDIRQNYASGHFSG